MVVGKLQIELCLELAATAICRSSGEDPRGGEGAHSTFLSLCLDAWHIGASGRY